MQWNITTIAQEEEVCEMMGTMITGTLKVGSSSAQFGYSTADEILSDSVLSMLLAT